jgi:hypothetical protein
MVGILGALTSAHPPEDRDLIIAQYSVALVRFAPRLDISGG